MNLHLAVSGKSRPSGRPKTVDLRREFDERRPGRWARVVARSWRRIQGRRTIDYPTRMYLYVFDEFMPDERLHALAAATADGLRRCGIDVQDVCPSRVPTASKQVLVVLNNFP